MKIRALAAGLALVAACESDDPDIQPGPVPVCASEQGAALEVQALSSPVSGTRVWQEGALESTGILLWSAKVVEYPSADCAGYTTLEISDSRVAGPAVTVQLRLDGEQVESATTANGTGGELQIGQQDGVWVGRFSITTASGRPLEGAFVADGIDSMSCESQDWHKRVLDPIRERLAATGNVIVDCYAGDPIAVSACVNQATADGNAYVTGWPLVDAVEFIGAPDAEGIYHVDRYLQIPGNGLELGDHHSVARCEPFVIDTTCNPWDARCFTCTAVSSTSLCEEAS